MHNIPPYKMVKIPEVRHILFYRTSGQNNATSLLLISFYLNFVDKVTIAYMLGQILSGLLYYVKFIVH